MFPSLRSGSLCSVEDAPSRPVASNTTADVFAGYGFQNLVGFTRISAGVNNVAATKPPRIYNGFLANTDASSYDFLGRYYYVNLRHNF